MSGYWRRRLHRTEPRISMLIGQVKDPGVLDRWDRKRGARWDDSEEDAKFIVKECLPVIELKTR